MAETDYKTILWNLEHARDPVEFPGEGAFFDSKMSMIATHFDRAVRVYLLAPGGEVAVLPGGGWQMDISPDGKTMAIGEPEQASVWDLQHFHGRFTVGGFARGVELVSFSRDNLRLLVAAADGKGRVVDATNGNVLMEFEIPGFQDAGTLFKDVKHFAYWGKFTNDGKRIVILSTDHSLRLYDVSTGKEIIERCMQKVYAAALSGDGKIIAVSLEGESKVLQLETGVLNSQLPTPDQYYINSLAINHDGSKIATIATPHIHLFGHEVGVAELWDGNSGKKIRRLGGSEYLAYEVRMSHDGHYVLTASVSEGVAVWNADSGERVATIASIPTGEFSQNDEMIVGHDIGQDQIRVVNATSGIQLATLGGHTQAIRKILFHPNNKWVVTASEDKTIRIHTINPDELLTLARHRSKEMRLERSRNSSNTK